MPFQVKWSEHCNRSLKGRRKSKFNDIKQDYVCWLQSTAMRLMWLKLGRRRVARDIGRGGTGVRSY